MEQLLGDLLGLMGSSKAGGGQMELARSLAHSVATGGAAEPNVEPLERIELERLARVAELHVSELTGLAVTSHGVPVEIMAVAPGTWAWHTLEDWRFLLDAMSAMQPGTGSLGNPERPQTPGPVADTGNLEYPAPLSDLGPLGDLGPLTESGQAHGESGPADVVARFMSSMGPMLAAMQLGSAVGHLARSTLGQYELPVPRPANRLLLVAQNISRFASDWSLPLDQVQLWVCLRELTIHAVLTRPHVAARWRELLTNVVGAAGGEAAGVLERLSGLDPTDPEALQGLLGDPEALFGSTPSPARERATAELESAIAALFGYVEHILDQAASRLLGGRTALAEAWIRRQHDREAADRSAELLLGMDLGPAQVERGVSFVKGVLSRAGEDGLAMLWSASHTLPTPAEIEAPGLWLERVRLMEVPSDETKPEAADEPDRGDAAGASGGS